MTAENIRHLNRVAPENARSLTEPFIVHSLPALHTPM